MQDDTTSEAFGYRDDLAAARERLAQLEEVNAEHTSHEARLAFEQRRQVLLRGKQVKGESTARGVAVVAAIIAFYIASRAAEGQAHDTSGSSFALFLLSVMAIAAATFWLAIGYSKRAQTRRELSRIEQEYAAIEKRSSREAPTDLAAVHVRIAELEDVASRDQSENEISEEEAEGWRLRDDAGRREASLVEPE